MKSLPFAAGLAVGACFVGGAPMDALAESAERASVEEIVVTARRREETAQSVPIPISAMSGDQLADRGITEIKNIEQITPNLSFLNSGVARGTAQVFLRGIGQVNWGPTQDPKVGVYVDGIYLGRPQGAIFDLLDIERVEVLRGPQGTLFGRNTTAGLVHVITKLPDSTFDAEISGGFGNDGQFSGDAIVNVPLNEDTLAARFALQFRKDDGFMEDTSGREWNSTDSQSFRGSLLWTPTETLDIVLRGEVFRARETAGLGKCIAVTGGPNGLNAITNLFGVFDDLETACLNDGKFYDSNDNDPNDLEIDTYSLALTATWDVGDVTLSSITGWRDTEELNNSWGWGTDFVGGPSFHIEVLGDQTSPYYQYSQEFKVEGDAFNDKLTWIAGIYGFHESGTQRLNVPFWRDVPLPGDPVLDAITGGTRTAVSRRQETHATNKSWAVFTEGTYDVSEKFAITAGFRWTKDSREFKRFQFGTDFSFDPGNFCPGMPLDENGFATESSCTQKVSYNETTPRIIFNYNATDDIMLYGSYSRGYSAGGMNGDIRMRPFEPEVSDNYEVGIKSQWWDKRLQVNLTAFQTDYENQQITVSRIQGGQPTADLINAQEATIEGIEGEIVATPWDGWFFTASFGFLDGEYDEFTTVDTRGDGVIEPVVEFVNDFSDTEFVGGAPYTYNIGIAYEHFTENMGSITTQVGWAYRGRTYNTLRRLKSSRQGKYGLLDGRIRWQLANEQTSIELWGTNLLDREYFRAALDLANIEDADGNPLFDSEGQPVQDLGVTIIYPSEPRRFGVTVSHSFNKR